MRYDFLFSVLAYLVNAYDTLTYVRWVGAWPDGGLCGLEFLTAVDVVVDKYMTWT